MAISKITSDAIDATGFNLDSNTLTVDATNNRVGIGLADPDTPLEVQIGSSGNALKLSSSADGASVFLAFEQQESGTKHVRGRIRAASNGVDGGLIFETGPSSSTSERVRIDNNGTFLVGKTAPDFDGGVFEAGSGGTFVSRSGTPFGVNRNGSNGELANFYKDGSQVGSISNNSTNLKVNGVGALELSENGTTRVYVDSGGFFPFADNTYDIGSGGLRFDDIFATNGTIQTSDQNEKQQIASLTDAEITAAKALSKLFKTFKWNDSVAAKGENARTHTGHIAQEVKSAMTDAGLDASKYAFFCSDTWWETQTEVPAVEANEENGIEAQDAYTLRNIYYTADEASEGATQHTRLGIRYPELLAFIGAATEQRLTSIEARLTALENE